MNYDQINKTLEKRPWITVAMAFIVVSMCLFILFMNYGKKVDTSAVLMKSMSPVALVERDKTTAMALQHQMISRSTVAHRRPLLTSLPQAMCLANHGHQQRFVPLCPRCNVPLENLAGTMFQCPICKQKSEVSCPICGQPMSSIEDPGTNTDSIYFCPICKREVVPNWEQSGVPLCPYCQNPVVLR